MSANCAPDCYTKGRGCMLSSDGKCIHIYGLTGEEFKKKIKEIILNVKSATKTTKK